MKKKILIVDDEQTNILILKSLFGDEYDLTIANDGQSGLDLAKEIMPDLMLLDVMMPKVNGFKVCGLLKSDHRYSKIPIIILSSRAGDDDLELSREVNANSYLLKPIDKEKLIVEINKIFAFNVPQDQ